MNPGEDLEASSGSEHEPKQAASRSHKKSQVMYDVPTTFDEVKAVEVLQALGDQDGEEYS